MVPGGPNLPRTRTQESGIFFWAKRLMEQKRRGAAENPPSWPERCHEYRTRKGSSSTLAMSLIRIIPCGTRTAIIQRAHGMLERGRHATVYFILSGSQPRSKEACEGAPTCTVKETTMRVAHGRAFVLECRARARATHARLAAKVAWVG
jgi:hypothetical protein